MAKVAGLLQLLRCRCRNEMEPAAIMPNTAAANARLEAQLAELEGRQDRIAQYLAEPLNPNSSEKA
jgi:hypothetical protein